MTADDKDRPKLDAETKAAFRQANSAIKELIQLVLLRDVNTRFPIDKGVIFLSIYNKPWKSQRKFVNTKDNSFYCCSIHTEIDRKIDR